MSKDTYSEMNKLLEIIPSVDYYDCREITDADISRLAMVLPELSLIEFIKGSLMAEHMIIDYEDQDKVYYCYTIGECIDILKTIRNRWER